MLERFTVSEIERTLEELIERAGRHIQPFQSANFSQPNEGTLVWQWPKEGLKSRLWKTFAFHDADGATVLISVVSEPTHEISEVEIWRGDSKPLLRFPSVEQINEVTKPGII